MATKFVQFRTINGFTTVVYDETTTRLYEFGSTPPAGQTLTKYLQQNALEAARLYDAEFNPEGVPPQIITPPTEIPDPKSEPEAAADPPAEPTP